MFLEANCWTKEEDFDREIKSSNLVMNKNGESTDEK